MSGRDLGHFGCDGRYRVSDSEARSIAQFIMEGVKQVKPPGFQVQTSEGMADCEECVDEGCPHYGTDHAHIRSEVPPMPADAKHCGLPDPSRNLLRLQSELISKYAAELDKFMQTHECRRNCDTCTELRSRATLARDISLIYFRAATLEV